MSELTDFTEKVVTITGGTGSFGSTMAKIALDRNAKEVRILSRDEAKQELMRRTMNDQRLRFFIGDVRDENSLEAPFRGTNFLFHAAALKQVPSCEFFPQEAVKTNVLGSANVLKAAVRNKVSSVVCLSTDKAVYPINAMGMSKALMEKTAQAVSRDSDETTVSITRYGNVLMSRGSVVPMFIQQIGRGIPLTLTDPSMTRFLMTLDESVDLVQFAFQEANSGDLFVRKAPACDVETLAKAVAKSFGLPNYEISIIGTRHGEKLFETLLSREEMNVAKDMGDYFKVGLDSRSLDYDSFTSEGDVEIKDLQDFHSHNAQQLDVDQVIEVLMTIPEYKQSVVEYKS
jgi:UDP-glucose 4-epimerase